MYVILFIRMQNIIGPLSFIFSHFVFSEFQRTFQWWATAKETFIYYPWDGSVVLGFHEPLLFLSFIRA